MKYYAVTEDPNELLHYGVKGMKWGQHIFGDRPKSVSFHKALGKLKELKNKTAKTAKAVKSSIEKSSMQIATNYQKRQQERYNKAIQRLQSNTSLINKIGDINRERNYYRQIKKDIKNERNAAVNVAKIENYQKAAQANALATQARQMKKAIKVDKNFDKILQKAREGRLRYGNLNEDQIRRVQDRLASEEMARRLGGKEKPAWRLQKKEARRSGRLKGIEQGTAAAMTEVARAGAQYGIQHLMTRHKLNSAAKYEGKRARIKNRQQNKRTHRDIARDVREEAFEERVRSGEGIISRNNPFEIREDRVLMPIGLSGKLGTKGAAKYLKAKNEEKERKSAQKHLEEINEQANDALYKKIILGGKNESTDNILKRFRNEREDIYRTIYGDSYDARVHNFDQPVQTQKRSKVTGAPKNKNKSINQIVDLISNDNNGNDTHVPLKYYVQPVTKTINLGNSQIVGNITGRRRKRNNNPLKG